MAAQDDAAPASSGAIPKNSRPDGLMVFDGVCNFCSAQVRLLLKIDRAGAIRFCAIQSPYGRHLAQRFGIDPDDPSTFLFFDGGRPLEKSDAVIALARRLPLPWTGLRLLRFVPRGLRDELYGMVARNRYRILGRRDECMVPTAQARARFVETVPEEEA
ncbi:MAG: thiol-disulfide oxidoreductase DCC family protein [Methylobacterium mesophilicum]|nr:thiol-disulfide oxidoreductase DCC family protein [Methylobacterium mesophilicum]